MKKLYLLTLIAVCFMTLSGCQDRTSPSTRDPKTNSIETGATQIIIPSPKSISWLAIGTEPFWSLEYTGASLLFVLADRGNTMNFSGITITTSGGSTIYTDISTSIIVTITTGSCSDGMSDITHPASIFVLYSGNVYKGCVK